MRYFIGQRELDWSMNRLDEKGDGVPLRERQGFIGLFDRNTGRFCWFRIVEKCSDRFGFIVERRQRVPSYWRNVIKTA